MSLKDYKFCSNYDSLLFPQSEKALSVFFAVNLFLMFQNGDDALYLDEAFSTGIIDIIIGSILPLITTQISFTVYVHSWRYGMASDYPSIFYDAFQSRLGYFIVAIIYILGFISFTSYFTKNTVDIFRELGHQFIGKNAFLDNKYLPIYVSQIIFTVPFLFFNNFSSFRYISLVANFFFLLTVVVTIYFMLESIQKNGFDPSNQIKVFSGDFWKFLKVFMEFNNLFYSHPPLCAIAKDIDNCKMSTVIKIVFYSLVSTYLFNIVCGFSIHFTFYGLIEEENALEYYDRKSFATTIGYISSLINIIISNGAAVFLASDQLFRIVAKTDPKPVQRLIPGLIIILLSISILIVEGDVGSFLDIYNDFVIIAIGYIIPCVCYLKMVGYKSIYGILAIALLILSTFLVATTIYTNFFME